MEIENKASSASPLSKRSNEGKARLVFHNRIIFIFAIDIWTEIWTY